MRIATILALAAISGSALAGVEPPPPPVGVPEPGILALLGIGAVAGLIAGRKRK